MMNERWKIAVGAMMFLAVTAGAAAVPVGAQQAGPILTASGVQGGFVVVAGGPTGSPQAINGKLLCSLAEKGPLLVQGLSTGVGAVAAAREQILSSGASDRVSMIDFDGRHLPYVDSLVNLLVILDASQLKAAEIQRALSPGGAAVLAPGVRADGLATAPAAGLDGWTIYRKPRPKAIDEWTHYLHDPQGTGVSNDTLVGQPRGLRWTGGPFWARSHEHTSSMNAMVAAGGRVFYVMDEGPVESIQLPANILLTARDAFSGVVLWKRPLPNWWNTLYPLKSGPGWLPRRLVAVGDRVYVAAGYGDKVLCLDAATGKLIRSYDNTTNTFELIVSKGVIFAAVDPDEKPVDYRQENANCWTERDRANRRWAWHPDNSGQRTITAINAADGKLLWKRTMPTAPMTLSADDHKICLYDGEAVVAMDRATGKELWRTPAGKMEIALTGYAGPRLILRGDRVIFSPLRHIYALDGKTGKLLWSVGNKPVSGHFSLEDFYVIGDKIWALRGAHGAFTVYDLSDGEVARQVVNPINSFYIHQRCYPGRATVKVLLPPIMGATIYDIASDTWTINDWIRGSCTYGFMPANGMIYATPHACACYYQSKLDGFNAVATVAQDATAPPADKRLTKGPAYGQCQAAQTDSQSCWPVFRHDNTRSGFVRTDVPADVSTAWRASLGGKLTQPVATNGHIYVAAKDTRTVYAIDAKSGKVEWHFVAGGGVDSPPTIHDGMAIFGCRDGLIYALRSSDGKLAWTFQAAPNDRRIFSYGQTESVWPLFGSVLIQRDPTSGQDKLYCVAGRSMFLDGGLRMVMLNPRTGELISENVMNSDVPGTDKNIQTLMMGKHMPVAMPDILSADAQHVYMKSQTFDFNGKRTRISPQRPDTQYGQEVHLFSPVSFLDDAWQQREYWICGRAAGEGWAEFQIPPKRVPCGRIMCIDDKNAYAYGREPDLMCNTSVTEYQLYSAARIPTREASPTGLEGRWTKAKRRDKNLVQLAQPSVDWKKLSKLPPQKLSALDYHWVHDQPDVIAKAMVLANDRLFIVGPRDVVNEKAMWGRSNEKIYKQKMQNQEDWLRGAHGSVLQVFSKTDGKKLAEQPLKAMPVFDGLIASQGRLYLTTRDGRLICMAAKGS